MTSVSWVMSLLVPKLVMRGISMGFAGGGCAEVVVEEEREEEKEEKSSP